jgi:hypothetical protein
MLTSIDEQSSQPRKFLIPVNETLERLLASEDTDRNEQITIEDLGPKVPPIRHHHTNSDTGLILVTRFFL